MGREGVPRREEGSWRSWPASWRPHGLSSSWFESSVMTSSVHGPCMSPHEPRHPPAAPRFAEDSSSFRLARRPDHGQLLPDPRFATRPCLKPFTVKQIVLHLSSSWQDRGNAPTSAQESHAHGVVPAGTASRSRAGHSTACPNRCGPVRSFSHHMLWLRTKTVGPSLVCITVTHLWLSFTTAHGDGADPSLATSLCLCLISTGLLVRSQPVPFLWSFLPSFLIPSVPSFLLSSLSSFFFPFTFLLSYLLYSILVAPSSSTSCVVSSPEPKTRSIHPYCGALKAFGASMMVVFFNGQRELAVTRCVSARRFLHA